MARAVAKVTTHAGGGAENAAYIGRPQEERSREAEPRPGEEPVAGRGERLAEMREGDSGPARGRPDGVSNDAPVWSWNVPWFVIGEAHGVWETEEGRALLENRSLALPARHLGLCSAPPSAAKLSADEKRENLIAHFSALADLEERQKGLSHFRIILTVGPEVSISELKAMVNAFLRANFPLCPAFVAVHDDTEHRHAHVYVHARQLDNRRVALGQDYFRLDENWMEICSQHLNDPEIYERHVELKEETRAWRERAEKARDAGKPLPPKPDRWSDHHDTLLVFRPFDDRWCGRLQSQARVAETRVKWLEATKARQENVIVAREASERLRARLDEAATKRGKSRSESKRVLPAEVITVSEARELLLYARDILKAEQGKGVRRKQPAPELRAEQGALWFNDTVGERESQPGFDLTLPAAPAQATASTPPDPRAGKSTPAREREGAKATPSTNAGASSQADEAARSLGRELVAEVKLAYTEACLSAEGPPKERRRLKEQLIVDRREHARASKEAARHCSLLAARDAPEPPYLLQEDERRYLSVMSGQVPEGLRERIVAEVARAQIILDSEEMIPRQTQEHALATEVSLPVEVNASQPVANERKINETVNTKREVLPPEELQPAPIVPPRPGEIARGGAALTLPDEEVKRLTMQYELARARDSVLRVAEEDFNAAPHHWLSPKYKASLASLEDEIARGHEGDGHTGRLQERREGVRDELAAERVQWPLRRRRAEDETRSLEVRLRHEMTARSKLGLSMPDVIPSAEELRELVSCAEAAHDARQLRRIFEAERDGVLREAEEGGSGEPVRLLEERYAGVKLMADVCADRSRVALDRATKEPDKMPLATTDEAGRDTVATLEQAGTRKGIRGTLGRLVESGERRRLREQLLGTKETYLNHLHADSEGREAFLKAAREIMRECRDLSRGFDYHTPAVPELSPEKIREARDHAVTRTGSERESWLTACTQSQKLKDEREYTATEKGRAERSVEIFSPGAQTAEERAALIRGELELTRDRLTAQEYQRRDRAITDRQQSASLDDPGKSRVEPDRDGESYRGR
jgi:hypothetical protein